MSAKKTSAPFALLSVAAFDALVKSTAKRQRMLDSDYQQLAVTAIGYSIIHGDVQPANRLFDAMSKSTRRQSMLVFFEKHGQLAWMSGDKKFAHFKREGLTFDGDYLMTQRWFEASAETLRSDYSLVDAFDNFMKRINKDIDAKKVNVADAGLVKYLNAAMATYQAENHTAAKEGEATTK